jgi:hypothetical protein
MVSYRKSKSVRQDPPDKDLELKQMLNNYGNQITIETTSSGMVFNFYDMPCMRKTPSEDGRKDSKVRNG